MSLSPLARQRAMFAFICFVWGTTWLAMKVGIATVPPGVFAGLRWSIAGAVLLTWWRVRGEPVLPPLAVMPRLIGVSVLLITLNQVIQLYGLVHITAGLGAVISSALTPIALLGFSVALGQERFTGRQIGALALGVAGVFTLFGPSALDGSLNVWELFGAGCVVVGCLCYSLGSVLTRPMMRRIAPVQLAGLTDLIGGLILLGSSLVLEPGGWDALSFRWGWPAVAAWLYLLVPGALMSTTMYFLLVRDWGASRPGTYAFISPVIAVAIGSTLFGEKLDWGDGVGMALMLLAAALTLRPRGAGGTSADDATPQAETERVAAAAVSATSRPAGDAFAEAPRQKPVPRRADAVDTLSGPRTAARSQAHMPLPVARSVPAAQPETR